MMSRMFKQRLFPIISDVAAHFGTPFHIYDKMGIIETASSLKRLFDGFGFQEFFAVKALPNPAILNLMANEGFGFDCSSIPELVLARYTGVTDKRIMFTSNNTSLREFEAFFEKAGHGGILNLDDITMINKLAAVLPAGHKYPDLACFRYNPGSRRTGNSIIGKPEEAKYGVTHEQIVKAYRMAINKGATRFGIHTMVCSNELNHEYMIETVRMLLDLVEMISSKLNIRFEFINMGGGIGIPYRPDQKPFDIVAMATGIKALIGKFNDAHGYVPKLFMESGRYMTGPHGVLVTKVINQKHTYREYRGVDACMSSLMRPAMYDAYHHIDVLNPSGRPRSGKEAVVDVVGSLCENNDKFAVQRPLPKMTEDDILVIHDTGAHGIAMGFQYNGRTRPKELLLRDNGIVELIGREETPDDLFGRYRYAPDVLQPVFMPRQ